MENSKTLNGLLIKATGGFYYVEAAQKVYECKARGIFRQKGHSPLVGDRVEITVPRDGYCSVDKILPRKNTLRRPPLANLDNLVIVCSTVNPAPNTVVIDKMTAAAVYNNIRPIIVISKSDLSDGSVLAEIYRKAGFDVVEYSSDSKVSAEPLKKLIHGGISAFTGNTGVGKSTLLNVLFSGLSLETGEVSKKLGRGRHTTRTVELFKIDDSYVADTPGFSTFDLEKYQMIDKDELQHCFPEFEDYLGRCRFTSCAHICEKGCSVIQAVENGDIPRSRHDSYKQMYNEVKDIKSWQK